MPDQKTNTHQDKKRFLDTWYKKLFLAIAIAAMVILAVRIVLNPIARYFMNQKLKELQGYEGGVKDVSVSIIPPGVKITGIKIFEDPGKYHEPFFSAERINLNISGKGLFTGTLVANVMINHPKVTIVKERVTPPEEKKPVRIPDMGKELKKAPPLRIDLIEVNEGEIVFIDGTEESKPYFGVHDMEADVKNVATREKLAQDRPTTVKVTAVIQKSGNMRFSMSTNPWERALNLSGEAELKGLALADLNDFLTAKTDLQAVKGTFDLFTSFKVENNEITGGIKPVLQNVDVASEKSTLLEWLKSNVVDATISLLSGPPEATEGKQKVKTVIPIKGTITDPNPQILPTVLGIIRNAFVEGLSAGFANLPPPTAPEKEGVIKQIIDAVTPGKGPPEAQPEKDEEEKEKE